MFVFLEFDNFFDMAFPAVRDFYRVNALFVPAEINLLPVTDDGAFLQ